MCCFVLRAQMKQKISALSQLVRRPTCRPVPLRVCGWRSCWPTSDRARRRKKLSLAVHSLPARSSTAMRGIMIHRVRQRGGHLFHNPICPSLFFSGARILPLAELSRRKWSSNNNWIWLPRATSHQAARVYCCDTWPSRAKPYTCTRTRTGSAPAQIGPPPRCCRCLGGA